MDTEPLHSGNFDKGIDKVLPHICDVCGMSRCSKKHNGEKCAKIRKARGFTKS